MKVTMNIEVQFTTHAMPNPTSHKMTLHN